MITVHPLTDEDRELIELARRTVDANTDGPDGVYTMGAAVRGVDGRMYAGSTSTTSPAAPVPNWSPSAAPAPKEPANSPQS
ncbi:hypothetical protein ACXC9Q_41010 [Kribbella sp. CWNU-51]